jgi:hypothetical protein
MSRPSSNTNDGGVSRTAEETASGSDKRRDDTITRIRAALLDERLAVMELSGENPGTDPYNSGVHRALSKAHDWGKRSR